MEYESKTKLRLNRAIRLLTANFFLIMMISSANAALVQAPLPANAYITLNGFDWAWGASCSSRSAADCDTPDFSFQISLGWRIAEAGDMGIAPTALNFLRAGANVPFNGRDPVSGAGFDFLNAAYTTAASAGACANSYFTLGDGNNTCDWGNGGGQNLNTNGWFNQNGETRFFAEVLFVRVTSPVPEPGTWLLLTGGLACISRFRQRLTA